MSHQVKIIEGSWYIAYNWAEGVYHFGFADAGTVDALSTGQPNLELFTNETSMANRLDQLKGVVGWYEANKPEPIEDAPIQGDPNEPEFEDLGTTEA